MKYLDLNGLTELVQNIKSLIKTNVDSTLANSKSYTDNKVKDYIKGLSVSGKTVTYTKGDGTTGTITTQDTNTTYGVATSSTLGLVKSGTDITIDSSGNVSVNDDSHNHTIANINNLQTTLDGKAATSHNHDSMYYTESEIDAKLDTHTSDTTCHMTSTERTNWGTAYTHSQSAHAPSNAEANQNAFSNIKVGSTTIAADTKTDTLELVAGSNITLTPDATNDKITIAATDTVYTHPTTSGNKHIPSGGSSGQILRWASDGTATWGADNNTTYTLSSFGITATADELNYVDGVTSNIQTQLNGKAASSHGNHVPTTETANNAKFLRNDNTWQTVTPANIGAAASSHGTHVTYSTTNPVMDGTASVGTATTVSRSDHVHPTDTSRAAADHTHDYVPLSGSTGITGTLRTTGEIQSTSSNAFRLTYGKRGCILRNDGSATYVLLTNDNDQYGNWNDLRPLTIDNSSGVVSFGNGLKGTLTGNASSSTQSNSISSTGYGSGNLTYLQTSDSFNDNSGWCHYLIANHGNGETYYNVMLGLPFEKVPMYRRQTGSASSKSPWYKFYTQENITYGTSALTAGSSSLGTGNIYLQYE